MKQADTAPSAPQSSPKPVPMLATSVASDAPEAQILALKAELRRERRAHQQTRKYLRETLSVLVNEMEEGLEVHTG